MSLAQEWLMALRGSLKNLPENDKLGKQEISTWAETLGPGSAELVLRMRDGTVLDITVRARRPDSGKLNLAGFQTNKKENGNAGYGERAPG